jgi:hypothetical protein
MLVHDRYLKSIQTAFWGLLLLLLTVLFLNSHGTGDVNIFTRWANTADTYGLISGFKANADYPPFTMVILFCALKVSRLFGVETFGAIKLSILFFLCATSFVFWIWTRDILTTAILHLSLVLNSVALGYTDIYFAPTLVLSLWALKERRLTLFTVFYSIACLTKWQPLIIAPFILLYILNINHISQWKQIEFKKFFRGVLYPMLIILAIILAIFGFVDVLTAFIGGLSNVSLSGNALNFNWIVTHLLHVFFPAQFGGLIEGQAGAIDTMLLEIILVPKLLFLGSYTITFVTFFKRDKTFENVVIFSLLGYLAYFTFNTGVHENHLFLATILAVVLFWVNRRHLHTMLIVVLMSNIDMLLFYGIDGTGLHFPRVIGKTIDIALVLSIFNVSFFCFLWWTNIRHRQDTQVVPPPASDLPAAAS